MLQIENLIKIYNNKKIVNIQDLAIPKGQSVGLVGNNGAGKTTFFRLVLDLVKATEGYVYSKNKTVVGNDDWKCYTGSFLGAGFLIDYLTPIEYFYFIGKLNGTPLSHIDRFIKDYENFYASVESGKYIRDLSTGNQNKVGIMAALLSDPEVLILDEPFANLDPSSQNIIKIILKNFNVKRELTTLISSHDLTHVTDVCDRVLLMEKGEIIKDLNTNEQTLNELQEYFYSKK